MRWPYTRNCLRGEGAGLPSKLTAAPNAPSLKVMRTFRLACLPFLLAACGQPAAENVPAVEAPVARGPNAFDVQLTLTPRAAEMLSGAGEAVTVGVLYFGAPTPDGLKPGDDVGIVQTGAEQVTVPPANGVILMPGVGYDPAREADVEGGKQVLVNVYSARRTREDNVLSCGGYEGPLAMAQQKPVEIRCDLIE